MKDEIVKFRNALEFFGAKDIDGITKDFEKIITYRTSPTKFWECKAHGAFKECYDVGESNFIVKFASNENQTSMEEAVLHLATDQGFKATFPDTIYIPLSVDLPIYVLENAESHEEYRFTYHSYRTVPGSFLDYVIIQKRVAETAEDHPNNKDIRWCRSDYEDNPIFVNGDKVPYKLLWDAGIDSRTWIADIIKSQGYDYFTNLADFLYNNHITDLHDRNVGYGINGEPIIFDWLS